MEDYLKPHITLDEDQIRCAKSLVSKRRALYVDATGNGKSLVALKAFGFLKYRRNQFDLLLVVAPRNAHQKRSWEKEIKAVTNMKCIYWEDYVEKIKFKVPPEEALRGIDVLCVKQTEVKRDTSPFERLFLSSLRIVLLHDEVHAFRNSASALTAQAQMLFHSVKDVWGMTATPLAKDVMNTWSICNFLYPGILGTKKFFIARFCNTEEVIIGRNPDGTLRKAKRVLGLKDQDEFKNYLRNFLVIGKDSINPEIHFLDYTLSENESKLYSKIAKGITLLPHQEDGELWIKQILEREEIKDSSIRSMKEVDRHSSRFIYLQSVVDGSLRSDGTFGSRVSSKAREFLILIKEKVYKGQSILVYFDYYTSMDCFAELLKRYKFKRADGTPMRVVESSPRAGLKEGLTSERLCKNNPYVVLCSRGASASENYYYVNNVALYDIPTTPELYLQMVGRITRKSTLFRGDLHLYIPRSTSIDEYKLCIVGHKMVNMSAASYETKNFPSQYLKTFDTNESLRIAKKMLLWHPSV